MLKLTCNTLRIDRGDGSPIVDYRIENGCLETRTLNRRAEVDRGSEWQPVTPEQLSSHVMSNTVVARWLRRRMGIHRLLRACMQQPLSVAATGCSSQIAA
jgi:hypothetical protein